MGLLINLLNCASQFVGAQAMIINMTPDEQESYSVDEHNAFNDMVRDIKKHTRKLQPACGLDRAFISLFNQYKKFENLPDEFWLAIAEGYRHLVRNLYKENELSEIYQEQLTQFGQA